MIDKDKYIEQLESLIQDELIPIYEKYYAVLNLEAPKLNIPSLFIKKKIPALLRADF